MEVQFNAPWTVVCRPWTNFFSPILTLLPLASYIGLMKKLVLLFLFVFTCCLGVAKTPESKTFLVLFERGELDQLRTSLSSIAEQLSPFFPTKTYTGNSELALVLEIPSDSFNACLLGEYWIALKDGRRLQLQQLAFRVFDLSENKAAYAAFVAQYEDELAQKKKALKIARAASRP